MDTFLKTKSPDTDFAACYRANNINELCSWALHFIDP